MILNVMKKPIPVEAIQWLGTEESLIEIAKWSNFQVYILDLDYSTLYVKALEATAKISIGSYVVKGVKDEVWPVREDIFNETYEILGSINENKCIN